MFNTLRTQLEQSAPAIDQKLCRRSAYNFIYGVSLFCFLRDRKLITVKKQKKRLSNIKKLILVLKCLQKYYPEFFYVDLPDYDLDDYTVRFDPEVLEEVAQETMEFTKQIKSEEEFWQIHEEFFMESF